MTRLRFRISLAVAVVLLLAFATAFALVGTTAVSAAMPGRVGAPDVTIPLAHRVDANEPLYRIAALGDVGTGDADEYAVASQVAAVGEADPFDALVLLGDNVYPDGNPARLNATVFTPFGPVLESGAALLPVIGNHDQNYADEQVAALGMPGRWYATRLGDVLFIGLDSNLPEDPVQLAWLQSTLAESSAQWIIAAMHHPPFSAGVHGSDEDTRDTFVPLFEKYGVDLVLAGHDHDYQRSIAVGGVTYVVSGAGAKVRSTGSADFTAASAAVLHFVEIGVWEDRLELTAISLDGVFDSAELRPNAVATNAAATFPIGGFWNDGEVAIGSGLIGLGAVIWLLSVAVCYFMPASAAGKAGGPIVAASTMSIVAVVAGIGFVTYSFAL